MKEKTFDELIEESPLRGVLGIPGINSLKGLMQLVRESTIAECRDIALQDDIIIVGDITTRIESLPTDRIKTEKINNYEKYK